MSSTPSHKANRDSSPISEGISESSQDDSSCRERMMDDLLTAAVTTVKPRQVACLPPSTSSLQPRRHIPLCATDCPESHKAPSDPELPSSSPPPLHRLPVSSHSLDADGDLELPPPLPVHRRTSFGSVCPDSLDADSDSELSPLLPVPRRTSLGSVCPDSLDAAYERPDSQPSPCAVRKSKLRPSPSPPQSPLRNIATKARSKASKKPRTRGLNLSSAQQQIFLSYFERGMTNGSLKTLPWREEVQASTGLTLQQVTVCIHIRSGCPHY
jgi:hypothetical protein